MDIGLALLSAVFSSLTAILGKKALSGLNSHLATLIRTGVVLVYTWCFVFALGIHPQIAALSSRSILYLVLSGTATGGSWLCYYRALSAGQVTSVTAVDKSSILLTMIIGMVFLGEGVSAYKLSGLAVIAVGIVLMLGKIVGDATPACLGYAAASALLAALTSVFAKVGLQEVDANLGTAIRTGIVLLFSGLMVAVTGSAKNICQISRRELGLLALSALSTSLAWLCYFNALRIGEASVVAPLDKLSTVITLGLSALILKEKLSRRLTVGAVLLTIGAVLTMF